ncbi:tetratricopeptide repeat protein [Aquimarina sp. MAR_2010_214]|uniref:AraC family transcriptional regulator n=1 Tax=Aquimarina sp. MAR_2010_214 TaxID=1250026 RepID=UPI000C707E84|nr:AraC family transcriptional regulator [Aquimarina sp. MAR_2010_214]PKV48547.1 tetratricopeptide repeat protein [Aquimarina sp. MAR_2010_214]
MQLRCYKIVLLFLISFIGYGQSFKVPDSLVELDFKELENMFNNYIKNNPKKAEPHAKAYLQKGKNTGDVLNIAKGFHFLASLDRNDFEKRIKYLDSAIVITKNIGHIKYPVVFYVNKGVIYEKNGLSGKALDHYLEGLAFAKKTNNILFVNILQHNIALLKRKLGKFEEAKSIFKKCLVYEKSMIGKKKNDTLNYLFTLSELITTYRQNKEIDSAILLNTQGVKMSQEKDIKCLFRLHKGIFQYYKKDFKNATNTIDQGLDELLKSKYFKYYENDNLINGYLFLGKSYLAVSKQKLAITYFKKLDSLIQTTNYLIPETRSAYLEIIDYYKSLDDKNNQLYYINRLLYNDSILNHNFRDINEKLIKDYDTPILLKEKEKLIASLKQENTKISSQNILISILLALSMFGFGYYYYRQRLYKKRFLKLLDTTADQSKKKGSSINKKTLNHLLDQLQKFEEKHGYLQSNLNAKDLAKSFGSNSSYLSKVVNTFKEKSFSSYINDLRINFVIDKLREDSIFRKYTVKAIAQEIGFNNAEAFSKAFYKKTGIYPSYFIKELEKQQSI